LSAERRVVVGGGFICLLVESGREAKEKKRKRRRREREREKRKRETSGVLDPRDTSRCCAAADRPPPPPTVPTDFPFVLGRFRAAASGTAHRRYLSDIDNSRNNKSPS
jgi:hypothetical protein